MSAVEPTWGVLGLPVNTKAEGRRVNFQDQFELPIETNGYRLAWSRACICPCKGVNEQTDQPDPNCTLCKDSPGWVYFGPRDYVIDEDVVGELDAVQRKILEDSGAVVIRGLMMDLGTKTEPFTEIGRWVQESGRATLTVRAENKLGYFDRVVHLDAQIVYSQTIDVEVVSSTLATRYPVTGVHLLRSATTVFRPTVDFTVTAGVVTWLPGKEPAVGDRVAIHYLCHPTWVVIEHPKTFRMAVMTTKKSVNKNFPGDYLDLPVKSQVAYEFLVGA